MHFAVACNFTHRMFTWRLEIDSTLQVEISRPLGGNAIYMLYEISISCAIVGLSRLKMLGISCTDTNANFKISPNECSTLELFSTL